MARLVSAWVAGLVLIAVGTLATAGDMEECKSYETVCAGFTCTYIGAGQCTYNNQAWNFNAIVQEQIIRGTCGAGTGNRTQAPYECETYKYSTNPMMPVCDGSSFRCLDRGGGYGCL